MTKLLTRIKSVISLSRIRCFKRNFLAQIKRMRIKYRFHSTFYTNKLLNGQEIIKLDICGGRNPYGHGYMNVDLQNFPSVDIVTDIRVKIPVPDNCVTEIYSCGTLEHFKADEVVNVLSEFYRVLKPGCQAIIGVPSLDKLCDAYLSEEIDFNITNQYLYGSQKDDYDIHKIVYNYESLAAFLSNAGFTNIQELDYDLPMHISKYMMKIVCEKKE